MRSLIEVTSMKLWMDKMQVVRRAIEVFGKILNCIVRRIPKNLK